MEDMMSIVDSIELFNSSLRVSVETSPVAEWEVVGEFTGWTLSVEGAQPSLQSIPMYFNKTIGCFGLRIPDFIADKVTHTHLEVDDEEEIWGPGFNLVASISVKETKALHLQAIQRGTLFTTKFPVIIFSPNFQSIPEAVNFPSQVDTIEEISALDQGTTFIFKHTRDTNLFRAYIDQIGTLYKYHPNQLNNEVEEVSFILSPMTFVAPYTDGDYVKLVKGVSQLINLVNNVVINLALENGITLFADAAQHKFEA